MNECIIAVTKIPQQAASAFTFTLDTEQAESAYCYSVIIHSEPGFRIQIF